VNGWGDTLDRDVVDVAREMENLPLASLLVTAIDVEGRMQGPALGLTRQVISATRMSIVASGGIADVADLRDLERIGAAAAVIGMALYTNSIDAAEAAREFAA
jgi:phosphoribosylformimino-5-aminoimidazole carboxamide ribotide isomerase